MSEQDHSRAQPEESPTPPAIQVGRGNPTDEELGAAIAVLSIALAPRSAPRAARDRPVVGGWNSYVRTIRREHRPGPGSWSARI